MKTFSIVVPVYYNESNLPETIPQLLALSHHLPEYQLELVMVDDGSGDDSLGILRKFQLEYPGTIKVVKLTRNFGSMAAIQAGFTVATGDCVGMISADANGEWRMTSLMSIPRRLPERSLTRKRAFTPGAFDGGRSTDAR